MATRPVAICDGRRWRPAGASGGGRREVGGGPSLGRKRRSRVAGTCRRGSARAHPSPIVGKGLYDKRPMSAVARPAQTRPRAGGQGVGDSRRIRSQAGGSADGDWSAGSGGAISRTYSPVGQLAPAPAGLTSARASGRGSGGVVVLPVSGTSPIGTATSDPP